MERYLIEHAYVHRRFEDVCRLLSEHPERVLQGATDSAAGVAEGVVADLHFAVGGFEVGKAVRIRAGEMDRDGDQVARLPVEWEAEGNRGLFPTMVADLEVYTLAEEPRPLTQVALVGHYRPPLSVLGAAGDALAGRRVAEATVHHFVKEIRERIERELAPASVGGPTSEDAGSA